jgi:transposase
MRTLLMSREFFVNKLRDHENEIRGLLRPFGLTVGPFFEGVSPGVRTSL